MENKKDIKIFVSHRIDLDSETIDNPLYVPVRCGAVFDKRKNVTMLGDNTGDNISEKRESFCELTVQYWAWKNVEADYYGLCHYRRYLSFSNNRYNDYNNRCLLNEAYMSNLEKYNLNNEIKIREIIEKNEIILPEYMDIRKVDTPKGKKDNVLEHWKAHDNYLIKEEYLDILLNLIKEYNLELFNYAIKYLQGNKYRGYNCFVMKKKYFFDMCEFQFNILFKIEKLIDNTYFGEVLNRIEGFFGEILFGIYCYYLENKLDIKIKNLQLVYFENTEKVNKIYPKFNKNNIPIVMMSSNYYVPYLACCIKSIINNASNENNYDIIILQKEISMKNRKKLNSLCENKSNISLRFYNPKKDLENVKVYIASVVYPEEAYYRLLAPWVLSNYNKAIIMDCDIILKKDIVNLYNENIDGFLVGAVKDIVWQGLVNNPALDIKEYIENEMNLDNPYNYINTGVMVMNLNSFRELYNKEDIIDFIKSKKMRKQEQDILNMLVKDKVKFLELEYNFYTETNSWVTEQINFAPLKSKKKYYKVKQKPIIIHYANIPKPWNDTEIEFAEEFWKVARETIFYETIISRLSNNYTNQVINGHYSYYHRGIISKNKKQKVKNFIKIFLPKGTKRHRFVKKLYFKLRGWPFVE